MQHRAFHERGSRIAAVAEQTTAGAAFAATATAHVTAQVIRATGDATQVRALAVPAAATTTAITTTTTTTTTAAAAAAAAAGWLLV